MVRIYALFTRSDHFGVFNTNEMKKIAWSINLPGENRRSFAVKPLHKKFYPFSILRPPPFKESVPRPRSMKIEVGKKEVWQPLLWMLRDGVVWNHHHRHVGLKYKLCRFPKAMKLWFSHTMCNIAHAPVHTLTLILAIHLWNASTIWGVSPSGNASERERKKKYCNPAWNLIMLPINSAL